MRFLGVADLARRALEPGGRGERVADLVAGGVIGAGDPVGQQVDAVVAERREDGIRPLAVRLGVLVVELLGSVGLVAVDAFVGGEEDIAGARSGQLEELRRIVSIAAENRGLDAALANLLDDRADLFRFGRDRSAHPAPG